MAAMPFSLPFLLLSTCYILSIAYALPSNSHPSLQLPNTTNVTTTNSSLSNVTTPLHAGRSIECFSPDTPRTESVIAEDCEFVFEAILRDPAGVMAMTKFTHAPDLYEYEVPAYWFVLQTPIPSLFQNNCFHRQEG